MWSKFKKSKESKTKSKENPVQLVLHLPMNATTVYHPLGQELGPPPALSLNGAVNIHRPKDYGDHKYRGLRVVLRSVSVLNLGPGREKELDVFSEETLMRDIGPPPDWPEELKKDNFHVMDDDLHGCGIGGDLPAIIPASDDCNPGTEIRHYLIVQIIGLDPDPTVREPHLSTHELEKQNHRIPFPPTPADTPLMENTATAIRQLYVVHTPYKPGESSMLDETSRSVVPELGIVDIQCSAPLFTVASPVSISIGFPCPSPKTTVFAFSAFVRQTQVLKSPRDGFETTSTKEVPFVNVGKIPMSSNPDTFAPALWRGTEAGGDDNLPWLDTVESRFPHSCDTRASTLPGIASPITLEHAIIFHVLYSVHGQAADGTPRDDPGELRRLRVTRKVVFPSCRLTQPSGGLPEYISRDEFLVDDIAYVSQLLRYYINKPCPTCGRGPVDSVCLSCSHSPLPHVRHDPEYRRHCSECPSNFLIPIGEPDHVKIGHCACVEWMKWKISPGGEKVLADAAEAGSIKGKQIEGDRVLATKLETEERARKGSEMDQG